MSSEKLSDKPSDLRLLPSSMSFNDGNVADNWRRFKQKIEFYFNALAVGKVSDKKKVGILMTAMGDAGIDVFNTFTDIDSNSSYAEVIRKFEEYCQPKKNTIYERFLFSQLYQGDRSVDAFIVELKTQARRCEFAPIEVDKLIRDRLVVGIANTEVRRELLRNSELTLDRAADIAKAWEKSESEAAEIGKRASTSQPTAPAFDVHRVTPASHPPLPAGVKCQNCGYEHRGSTCPAHGRECNYCHKPGHFASVCRKRQQSARPRVDATAANSSRDQNLPVQQPAEDAASESPAKSIEVLNLFSVSQTAGRSAWYSVINVCGTPVRFKIDSGAECNTILSSVVAQIQPAPLMRPTKTVLRPYGDAELIVPKGEITVPVSVNGVTHTVKLFVLEFSRSGITSVDNILGLPTIEVVGLVTRAFSINNASSGKSRFLSAYQDVFNDNLGNIAGSIKLAISNKVVPVAEKPRRFPFALKDKLCAALVRLEKLGVIAKVNEPTEWVSNLIVVTKPNGDLRICLDPKQLNVALIVPKCEIPRADDIFAELHDKRYFTVFDLKDGFWQLKLDSVSSYLTTFNSPIGRFRWNRLVMGISSAPEIFMNKMRELFADLKGVYPYFDDIIVTGVDEADHDENLTKLLDRARQVGVKFNPNKIQFKQQSVNYLGFQVSQKGVKPLPKHVRAIADMPRPTDRNGVLRLLGLVRYLARFIPNLSASTEELRRLTRKDVPFVWLPHHDVEFDSLKSKIQSATNLRFYKPTEPLFIQTDSSKSGMGCCLYQSSVPLAYASRALTRTEENYAQIEKELLAVVFSLEKFHDYTYGRFVTVCSDHRPLVAIVKKPIAELTPRLQRLRLRLLRYNFEIVFQPGKELHIADTLSRTYLSDEPADETYQELDVHACCNIVASPARYRELVAATDADPDLQKLKVYLRGGWPKSKKRLTPALSKFRTIANDLSVQNGVVHFKNRVVIPAALISSTLRSLHEGHLNVQKTKQLARNTVFWLGMSVDIDLDVATCETCNRFRNNNVAEKLLSFSIPTRPWQRLHTDILTHNSIDFLVVYDSYSHWLELFSLKSKSIVELITIFKTLFARFGIPSQIVSDNVPYNSAEWHAFAEAWNFEVLFSSPRYPQANGIAEKAVGTAKRILQKNVNLHYALLQYRAAPIPQIGYSPAQLLMSRNLRTKLPITEKKLMPTTLDSSVIHDRKLRSQSTQHYYRDRGARDLPPLSVGEEVYYKKDLKDVPWQAGKISQTGTNPRSYEVTDAQTNAKYLRNRRFIRKPARYINVLSRSTSSEEEGCKEC